MEKLRSEIMEKLRSDEVNVLDTHIKGISIRMFWNLFAGWTTIVFIVLMVYFGLKGAIESLNERQSKVDAIQDIKIEQLKNDIKIQSMKIDKLEDKKLTDDKR